MSFGTSDAIGIAVGVMSICTCGLEACTYGWGGSRAKMTDAVIINEIRAVMRAGTVFELKTRIMFL